MYKISRFNNVVPGFNIKNINDGEVIEYDKFSELARTFRSCRQGYKLDEYFVRGALDPFDRRDKNLSESNIFVIDGDQSIEGGGCPGYDRISPILANLGLEYCYYTTYSKTPDTNKFRILIPFSRQITRPELKVLAKNVITFMNSAGLDIGYVPEMGTWSQPWFYPTREDPTDGLFEWHYKPGEPLDVDKYLIAEPEKGIFGKGIVKQIHETAANESKTIAELIKGITEGTDYHQNIIILSYGQAKDGMPKGNNVGWMRALMNEVKHKDARWKERYDDIERTVQGAYDRLDTDQEAEIDDYGIKHQDPTDHSIPWPPGYLGELCDIALGHAIFPHREVAFVSALGLVAAIAGRKFNVNSGQGIGLNVYFMLAAGTGVGKNSIVTFIDKYIPAPDGGVSSSFIGPSDFTAATGLIKNHLAHARCMISIMGEMGYIMESEAGNKSGKRAVMLELYTNSGHNDVMKSVSFSDADKSIPAIDSPAFSVIGESTPDKLIANIMKEESVKAGLFPRFSVFRINKPNRISNHIHPPMPDYLTLRIAELVETCEKIQSLGSFECHLLNLYDPQVMYADRDYWRGQMIDLYANGEEIKSATASRVHVKTLKYAGLATVFNKAKHAPDCLIIEEAEWEWAKAMVRYEMETVTNFFQGVTSGSPMDDAATRVMGKYILLAMDPDSKNHKKLYASMDPVMRKDRAISVSVLRQITSGQFTSAGFSNRDAFDDVIKHMIDQDYIRRDRKYHNQYSHRPKDCIIVKQGFYDRLQAGI